MPLEGPSDLPHRRARHAAESAEIGLESVPEADRISVVEAGLAAFMSALVPVARA